MRAFGGTPVAALAEECLFSARVTAGAWRGISMNFRLIFNTMGYILWVEAGFLMLPPVVALVYGENCWLAFLLSATLCGVVGTLLHLVKPKKAQMHSRDGFMAVALSWILL